MKKQSWKRFSVLPAALALVFTVSACGSNNDVQTSGGSSPGASQAGESSPAAGNKPGGKVVVYTAGPKGLSDAIKAGFEAKTGITLEQFEGTTGKVLGRLEAEKSNPVADVVVLASWPSAIGMKQEGWTQAYAGAANADKLQPGWRDADDHFFGYSASALGVTYNTNLVKNAPGDWSDFVNAEWKDAVNIPDPSLSGSALDFLGGYLNEKGEEGWSLFEGLKKNGVAMAGANAEALDPVITGAKSAVVAGVDYMAYSAKAKGEPVDIIYPESGTVINPRPAMILKDAPNLDNARLFIDYLLSDEAQGFVADAYLLPGRTDIPAKDRAGVEEIKLLQYDWEWMTDNSDAISARFLELFKQ